MSKMLKRSLFHLSCGLSIPVAALFLPKLAVLVALGVVTSLFLMFEVLRFAVPEINNRFHSIFRPLLREEELSRVTGASYMAIASLMVLLVFERDIAVLALSFLAVGDTVATLVSKQLGKVRFLKKTIEGNLACFVSCIATGLVYYFAGLDITLFTILLGSASATIAEALPLPIDDNLTMPLFAGLVMTLMQL